MSDNSARIVAQKKRKKYENGLDKHRGDAQKAHQKRRTQRLNRCDEATGIYHESVCHFLHDKAYSVAVLLPSQTKAYAKSLNAKSKNDKADAQILALMGLE